MTDRTCRRCGAPIPAGRQKTAKFCSDDCQRRKAGSAASAADRADRADAVRRDQIEAALRAREREIAERFRWERES